MPILCKLPIEVPFTIGIFALMFSMSISTNWMMYRTCYTILDFNETECALLGTGNSTNSTVQLENAVQPYVTVISMVNTITQSALAAVTCFFFGPWSDKYGRKPVLLLTYAGFALSSVLMTVVCIMPNLSPWFLFVTILPIGLTGGFLMQLTAVLCYITDLTTTSNRGIRIAVLDAAFSGGILLGTLPSSFALNLFGYTIMYAITSFAFVVSWLLILLCIPESVPDPATTGKFSYLFQIENLKRSLNGTFKKRSNYRRATLLVTISILLTYVFIFIETNFTFLYLRKMFKWSLEKYTIYSGANTVTGIFGSLIAIYILHSLMKINEAVMVIIGLFSVLSGMIVVAFATNSWYIYAGGGLRFLAGVIGPMSRSLISKLVMEDCSAVFGFIAVCEAVITLIARFVYTYIYNNTFSNFPPGMYFFTAGICLFGIILNIGLLFIQKQKTPVVDYQIITN